ncbi:MAG: DNA polymerase sliding clamp [Methanophagales virus PBV300]|uniref:DNA polymerase sliding clamp n=1 Tax=Methanophagales virus PBV300 TaxID=2987731 RepID=A0ABY6GM51_9VIRU|nr:MAG: DNA polymerase sliding clamp [Methanophagales virus PBV300]UYL65008.1 MAG: DNA polymerase sliding clamp [Methanophagales virus PBV300]
MGMFEGMIEKATLWDVVRAAHALVTESRVFIDNEGWHIKAIDPANVAMVIVDVPPEAFIKYELKLEEEEEKERKGMEIGISIDKTAEILRSVGRNEEVFLAVKDTMFMKFGNFTFSMNLYDPSTITEAKKVPEIEFTSEVIMNGEDFRRAIEAAKKVSEYVTLSVKNAAFTVRAEVEGMSMEMKLSEEELTDFEEGDARSTFSLTYLTSIARVFANTEVIIKLGNDVPVEVSGKIADGSVAVTYLLAPTIM